MEIDRWKKLDHLVRMCLGMAHEEREILLTSEGRTDPKLVGEARHLVNTALNLDGFLDEPLCPNISHIFDSFDPRCPFEMGNYTAIKKIGEGGMGIIYLAQQKGPLQRKVALKVLRGGLLGKGSLGRFTSEYQTLARMNHPYIAHIYDAGFSQTGVPYFTMEYLEGFPLTDFCEHHRLELLDRLELFKKVCGAVQHAHDNGIIHRDLKPSNIMVLELKGQPVPKIIDFGLAQSYKMTTELFPTRTGGLSGTPPYMSPEQATFYGPELDVRTDIYSLGCILYELLTGSKVHNAQKLNHLPLPEMLHVICHESISPPSERLWLRSKEHFGKVFHPHVALQGELDRITLKALAKARHQRYDSVDDLRQDLRIYVNRQHILYYRKINQFKRILACLMKSLRLMK